MEKMQKAREVAVKALDWSERILSYSGAVFLVLMTVLVFLTVVTRYVFSFTFGWSDEVALLFMVWFGFIGLAIGIRRSIHLSIEFVVNSLPPRYQSWIAKLNDVLEGLFGWFMLRYGTQLYHATKLTRLTATRWSRGLLFIMVPISGACILVYALASLLGLIRRSSEDIDSPSSGLGGEVGS